MNTMTNEELTKVLGIVERRFSQLRRGIITTGDAHDLIVDSLYAMTSDVKYVK